MWEFFIAFVTVSLIGFILYRRLRRSPEDPKKNVAARYALLISGLSEGKPRNVRTASRAVKFDLKKNRDLHVYVLTETEAKLIVVWTLESQSYGRRGKEWSFDSTLDQNVMLNKVHDDLKVYMRNIHNS